MSVSVWFLGESEEEEESEMTEEEEEETPQLTLTGELLLAVRNHLRQLVFQVLPPPAFRRAATAADQNVRLLS